MINLLKTEKKKYHNLLLMQLKHDETNNYNFWIINL